MLLQTYHCLELNSTMMRPVRGKKVNKLNQDPVVSVKVRFSAVTHIYSVKNTPEAHQMKKGCFQKLSQYLQAIRSVTDTSTEKSTSWILCFCLLYQVPIKPRETGLEKENEGHRDSCCSQKHPYNAVGNDPEMEEDECQMTKTKNQRMETR